jgi:hypothetical protein
MPKRTNPTKSLSSELSENCGISVAFLCGKKVFYLHQSGEEITMGEIGSKRRLIASSNGCKRCLDGLVFKRS